MTQAFDVTALILAGGQGQRMGGVDKGLQEYHSQPMVEHMLQLVSPVVSEVMISANRNLERYQAFTSKVFCDVSPWQGIGPLAGLYSILEAVNTSHLLVVPCDTPCLSEQALLKLISSARNAPAKIHFLESASGRQPLHAILPVALLKQKLPEFLEFTDHYGVMGFYKTIGVQAVYWEHDHELVNINHIQQLV